MNAVMNNVSMNIFRHVCSSVYMYKFPCNIYLVEECCIISMDVWHNQVMWVLFLFFKKLSLCTMLAGDGNGK